MLLMNGKLYPFQLNRFPNPADLAINYNDMADRGIDVVRNRIKTFAQKKVTLPRGRHKLVILDEADSMTTGAQQALRRTMEIYSSTTRFAFACNQSNKIIEPIQSRCAILRYARLSDAELLKRLLEICVIEKVRSSFSPSIIKKGSLTTVLVDLGSV
jgi:replication factor C subunit 2/4